jgi:hypothetical protein
LLIICFPGLVESRKIWWTNSSISARPSAVASAYDKDETAEQLFRELQLASVLEAAVASLRSGEGWQESTTIDVFNEILHIYPSHVKWALAMALLSGKF